MAESNLDPETVFKCRVRTRWYRVLRQWLPVSGLCCSIMLSGCQATPHQPLPINPADVRHAAQIAYQQGDLLSAESMLLNNVRRFEKDVDSWFLLGNVYLRTAQYPAAQRAYLQASKYKPEQAEIWHNLAVVYVRMATQALLEGSLHSEAEFEPLLGWLLQMQGAQSAPKQD